MIVFIKKISGLKIKETWFEYKHTLKNVLGINSFMHVKSFDKKPIGVKKKSHTVENSLLLTEDEIFSKFSSTVRNEIRKVENDVVCFFHNDIVEFAQFYNDFAELKGIDLTSVQKIIEIGNSMLLSFAKVGEQIVAAHSYIVDYDLKIARLFHSATCRLSNEVDRNLVGKANKLLHFQDMKILKEMNFQIYDFGGYAKDTTNKSLDGINKFKLSFGGEIVSCENYYSYSFSILKKIEKMLNRK